MPNKALFAVITKIDAATRTVSGIAMQEIVDRTNEICDYEKSKPFFKNWSSNQEKASGGKSKGNVRSMHNSKVAGIVTSLECDDNLKAFLIDTKIIPDDEWALVEGGGYTGFSIGANFAKGHKVTTDPDGAMRWVADPVEVSLVDVPCVPTALFEYKDAAGHVSQRKFANTMRMSTQKSMYSVSQMAAALADISWLIQDLDWEAQYENDDSQIPTRLRSWMEAGATIFLDLTEEETSEFAAMITAQKSARADRTKAGGCACGCTACADCTKKKALQIDPKDTPMTAEQQKSFDAGIEQMKTAAAAFTAGTEQIKAFGETLTTVNTTVTSIDTRLKAVEADREKDAENMKAFGEFVKAFEDTPEPTKTKHVAVAVPREADKGGEQGKAEPKPLENSTQLHQNKAPRVEALKSIYEDGGQPGFAS